MNNARNVVKAVRLMQNMDEMSLVQVRENLDRRLKALRISSPPTSEEP